MKNVKQFIVGFITCAILLSAIFISGFAEDSLTAFINQFPIFINGEKAEVEAYNINGRTYLALGDIAKYFDATVVFNDTDKRIDVNKNPKPITTTTPTPQSAEETIVTSDFYVLEVNSTEVWVKDSNNKTYGCSPSTSLEFVVGATIKGYFAEEYLFLQDTNDKFIRCYLNIPPDRTYKGSN
ncbi:stalk domain-containing protein [Lutispora sp.]|uniref:stalk domain-containing protein n=1 Tax=Lutispora sp. TaxID=2828727 RepID=UPI0035613610